MLRRSANRNLPGQTQKDAQKHLKIFRKKRKMKKNEKRTKFFSF